MRPVYFLVLIAAAAVTSVTQAPTLQPVQPDLFASGGAFLNAWADVDQDGDLDLFVGFNGTANRLYRNDAGLFNDIAVQAGLADARATRAAAWGDYDGDGDPDLMLGFAPGAETVLQLRRNEGGRFADVTGHAGLAVAGGAVRQLTWIDVDHDADLDLFVAFRDRPNALFRQEAGRFTDVAEAIGLADARKSVGAVSFDYDGDGDLDLYVANMDGDANGLFENQDGRFHDVAVERGLAWGGRAPNDATNGTVRPCAEDVDNDGRLDLFMANYGPNGLFLNRDAGRFEDVSAAWGIAIDGRYDACAFGDFDHDGRLDLYVNGTVTGGRGYPDTLFRNADSAFEDVTPENIRALEADHGVQWADFDQDGDLDLALTGSRPDAMHTLFANMLAPAAARRSLQIMVRDAQGRARFAGAEVCLFEAGTANVVGCRLVDTGSGYNSQNLMPVHLGLPSEARVDLVVVPKQTGTATIRMNDIDVAAHFGRILEVVVR